VKALDANDILRERGADALRAIADGAEIFDRQTPDARNASWRDHTMTAAKLQHMRFPPVAQVVPGVIVEGLSILAGRPKLGKSWAALDICLGVSASREVLGGIDPISGDTLYCALEDTPRRLQSRTTRLLGAYGMSWPERLTLATRWRRLDAGGVDDISEWADSVAEPRLVVLDTLAGVRPQRLAGDQLYDGDYRALLGLHQLAGSRGLAVLVLHHTRKMEADDPLDTVSGTLGLAGCADAVLVLARNSQGTTLYMRGRDIEEAERAISFDKATCRWSILGDAAEIHRSNERSRILEVLKGASELLSPQNIVAATGMGANNVWQLLHKMAADGQVVKAGKGKYRHPDRGDLDPRSGR
jgi:RecA-family ATPase